MSDALDYGIMPVTRIRKGRESWIEPGLDQAWSDLEQLRWKAGVVLADTGIELRIADAAYLVDGCVVPGRYGYTTTGQAGGLGTFDEAWCFLTGVIVGAQLMRR